MELNIDIAGSLFPNLLTFVVQLCSTGVLFYFLSKFLWEPARSYLQKRADYAQEQITQAETLKEEAHVLKTNANETLKTAGSQARTLVDKAKNDSVLLKESMLKQAKEEAEAKLDTARKEIAYEKKAMKDEVAKEIVEVAMAATEKLLVDKVNDNDDRQAIESFVKELYN